MFLNVLARPLQCFVVLPPAAVLELLFSPPSKILIFLTDSSASRIQMQLIAPTSLFIISLVNKSFLYIELK
uniref:Uncharacterized protein n=1 Tax=Brassica oleracea var. oleracea TaxID=109376 RepID=A0A0D3AG83_BRAOL